MTKLLQEAINRVTSLPAKEQNTVAQFLLAELDADAEWDKAFNSSQKELEILAQAALAEHHLGKTKKMNFSHDF
jgi:hypothetical protein